MANLRKYAQETSPVADCENMHTAKIILSTEYFVFTPQSRRLSARRRDTRRLAKTTPAPKKRGWGGESKPTTTKEPPARALESEDDDDDYTEDETVERLPSAKIEIW